MPCRSGTRAEARSEAIVWRPVVVVEPFERLEQMQSGLGGAAAKLGRQRALVVIAQHVHGLPKRERLRVVAYPVPPENP